MNSLQDLLMRRVSSLAPSDAREPLPPPLGRDTELVRLFSPQADGELAEEDCRLILHIADQLFRCPTRPSREIARELGVEPDHLRRLCAGMMPCGTPIWRAATA